MKIEGGRKYIKKKEAFLATSLNWNSTLLWFDKKGIELAFHYGNRTQHEWNSVSGKEFGLKGLAASQIDLKYQFFWFSSGSETVTKMMINNRG